MRARVAEIEAKHGVIARAFSNAGVFYPSRSSRSIRRNIKELCGSISAAW